MKPRLLLFPILLGLSGALRADVILNEYNAVRADRWLDLDGLDASTASDSHFGRVQGNGGRWFEMVVVGQTALPGETVDMRGWSFDWSAADVGSGSFTLSNDARLAGIHRGTLLTFFSKDALNPENVDSNFDSYNPHGGDWWLNINLADPLLILSGSLNTGNDNWQVSVRNSVDALVYGPAGEGVGFFEGVNSREVGKLEAFTFGDPMNTLADWQAIGPDSLEYQDGTSSTFGSENIWSGGSGLQDLSILRAVPEPGTLGLLLLGLGLLARRFRKN